MVNYCTWGVYNGRNWDILMTILHLSIVGCLVCDNLRSWRIMFSLLESWPWLGGGIFNWLPTIGKKKCSFTFSWLKNYRKEKCLILLFVMHFNVRQYECIWIWKEWIWNWEYFQFEYSPISLLFIPVNEPISYVVHFITCSYECSRIWEWSKVELGLKFYHEIVKW